MRQQCDKVYILLINILEYGICQCANFQNGEEEQKKKNTSCSGALGKKDLCFGSLLFTSSCCRYTFGLSLAIRIIIICKIYVKCECFNVIRIFRLPFIATIVVSVQFFLLLSVYFFFYGISVVVFGFVFMMTASYLFSYKLQHLIFISLSHLLFYT